jgi:predicted dienelactone hydrolase
MHFTWKSTFYRIALMSQPSAPSDFPSGDRKPSGFAKRLVKGTLKSLAALALLAVVALMMLFGLLWREHKTEITLPAPTGHFAVGRTTYTWVNNAETDELSPTPGAKREVAAWIWYPSGAATSATAAEYLPGPWRLALEQHSGALMSQFLTRDLSRVRTHSKSDPEVSPEQRSYPVVIMRAGGGALTTDFTTLAEDLASHGYFVVGFDAPYRTFVVVLPDGRVVSRPPTNDPENLSADEADRLINRLLPMWISDTKFVVSQLVQLNAADPSGKFTGRLDMQRLGMFGHSFGGAQTLQFCHDDPRCKAGIDIDGAPYGSVVQEGLKQPVLFLLSDHSREMADPASQQILANFRSLYDRLPGGRLFLIIRGANHFSFSDQMLVKSHYVIGLLRLLGVSGLEGRRGLAITAAYVHTFFEVHLKDAPAEALDKLAQLYPEVQVQVVAL